MTVTTVKELHSTAMSSQPGTKSKSIPMRKVSFSKTRDLFSNFPNPNLTLTVCVVLVTTRVLTQSSACKILIYIIDE